MAITIQTNGKEIIIYDNGVQKEITTIDNVNSRLDFLSGKIALLQDEQTYYTTVKNLFNG